MKTLFKIIIAWVLCASILVLLFLGVRALFRVASEREQKAMDTEYCFVENADGSLYHYECQSYE